MLVNFLIKLSIAWSIDFSKYTGCPGKIFPVKKYSYHLKEHFVWGALEIKHLKFNIYSFNE